MSAPLRSGYTTGTCAAAAAKAAALLLRGEVCHAVEVTLPGGEPVTLAVEQAACLSPTAARAVVVKDAGDDPDVTNGMCVVVTLELGGERMTFHAGDGVGTVTRPGLQIAPGEAAINPVPRQMIREALRAVLGETGCRVTVSIPGGAETAAKTFNPRLGIEGGLSILGTSGRVQPKSEEAWLRSLIPQIDVALAAGERTLYLVPGGFGERAARQWLHAPEVAIVQTSNFIGDLLRACAERQVGSVVLVGHVGKLVKIAAGLFNTHSRFGDARLETIAAVAAALGAPASLTAEILDLPTAEAAIPVLAGAGFTHVWEAIADRAARRATAHAGLPVACLLIGYDGEILGTSQHMQITVDAQPVQNVTQSRQTLPETASGTLAVVGVGPGPAEWMSPLALEAIRQAEVVVGGRRHLEQLAPAGAEQLVIGAELAPLMDAIRARLDRRVVVLASGDPGCYGILAALRRELGDLDWQVIPGISAFQVALARLRESWEEVTFASAHGRGIPALVERAYVRDKVLAFTDHTNTPQAIAAALVETGVDFQVVVLERLGYPDERITRGTAAEIAGGQFDPLSVIFLERVKYTPPVRPDDASAEE